MACNCPDCEHKDPPDPGPKPKTKDKGANDPAFIATDPVFRTVAMRADVLLQRQGAVAGKSDTLVREEQRRHQEFVRVLKATPEKAYDHVLEIWQSGVSSALQRLVIHEALPVLRSTNQSESLQTMLRALNNVQEERAEVIRLAKGNGLEKSLAMKRLELLEANPLLRETQQP